MRSYLGGVVVMLMMITVTACMRQSGRRKCDWQAQSSAHRRQAGGNIGRCVEICCSLLRAAFSSSHFAFHKPDAVLWKKGSEL